MIICICNRLNEAAVETAIACGARSPDCIQAHHGKGFNCGRCRDMMADMLAERSRQRSDDLDTMAIAAE